MSQNTFFLEERDIVPSSTWLVTGGAGFIGSHIVDALLGLNQKVRILDNFSTGSIDNLEYLSRKYKDRYSDNVELIEGDVVDSETCFSATKNVKYVLHQAALGSVPRSIEDPVSTHLTNVDGHLNMLLASKENGVERFVYASSSSVYGDSPLLPKKEEEIGNVLSPYALTKLTNEKYASIFSKMYGIKTIGLRYFNVFGPRQNPNGAYAAVIPKWINTMSAGRQVIINGDSQISRDFTHVANVVAANITAATANSSIANGQVVNIAGGRRITLASLFETIKLMLERGLRQKIPDPVVGQARLGDVQHSYADISMARDLIGYRVIKEFEIGIEETVRSTINAIVDKHDHYQKKK